MLLVSIYDSAVDIYCRVFNLQILTTHRLTPVGVTEDAPGVCDEDGGMDVRDGKT